MVVMAVVKTGRGEDGLVGLEGVEAGGDLV